jgi:hypothetical protein
MELMGPDRQPSSPGPSNGESCEAINFNFSNSKDVYQGGRDGSERDLPRSSCQPPAVRMGYMWYNHIGIRYP